MILLRLIFLAVCVLFFSACSNTKYCEREQDFDSASENAPLRAPEGLSVPEPDPNFVVPQASKQAQAAALTQGRPCLEIPPLLKSNTVVEEEG